MRGLTDHFHAHIRDKLLSDPTCCEGPMTVSRSNLRIYSQDCSASSGLFNLIIGLRFKQAV